MLATSVCFCSRDARSLFWFFWFQSGTICHTRFRRMNCMIHCWGKVSQLCLSAGLRGLLRYVQSVTFRFGVALRLFFFIHREINDFVTHDGPFSLLYLLLPPLRKEIRLMLLPCCLSGPDDRSYPNMMWAFDFWSHLSDVTVYYNQ
jgi:hypothetical protein